MLSKTLLVLFFFVKLQLAEKLLLILLNHRADFSCCTIQLDFWGGHLNACPASASVVLQWDKNMSKGRSVSTIWKG